jgi:hypothetical protein
VNEVVKKLKDLAGRVWDKVKELASPPAQPVPIPVPSKPRR